MRSDLLVLVPVWYPLSGPEPSYRRRREIPRPVTATADPTTHSLADHHPLRPSTASLKLRVGDWPALVDEACKVSTFAVELSALSGASSGLLDESASKAAAAVPLRQRARARQAPGSRRAGPRAATRRLPLWVRSIVAHPDGLVEPDAYRLSVPGWCSKNMEMTGGHRAHRRRDGDRLPGIARRQASCFDLAHAHSIDRFDGRRHRTAPTASDPASATSPQLTERRGTTSLVGGRRRIAVHGRTRSLPRRAWILEAPPSAKRWTARSARDSNWWRQVRRWSATPR